MAEKQYHSTRPSLIMNGKTQDFQFKNGLLLLSKQEDINEFELCLKEMSPASRRFIRSIDVSMATKLAAQHRQQAVQGGTTSVDASLTRQQFEDQIKANASAMNMTLTENPTPDVSSAGVLAQSELPPVEAVKTGLLSNLIKK